MEVLQDKLQISKARQELVKRGVSFADSPARSLMKRLRLRQGIAIGDRLKSWDVFSVLDFIENHVQKDQAILDAGCYASELIVALHKLGYSNLTGVDLNPQLSQMPHPDSIRYINTDFMHTNFNDASFQVITAISVIEHGFDGASLLKEISRLLRSGGYFIASFDYWPEKINTTGIEYFRMDWQIFSKDEISKFIKEAEGYGLFPHGKIIYEAKVKPIDHGGRQYTFALLTLVKRFRI